MSRDPVGSVEDAADQVRRYLEVRKLHRGYAPQIHTVVDPRDGSVLELDERDLRKLIEGICE